MKRLSKVLLCITVLMLLVTNNVFADDTIYTEGSLNYIIKDDGTIEIINYFGRSSEVKIPMSIGTHFVSEIGEDAFKDKKITSIELPDTITSISSNAFENIEGINITYFDKDDVIVEKENPIVYPEVKPQEEENKEKEEAKQEETVDENENDEDIDVSIIEIEANDHEADIEIEEIITNNDETNSSNSTNNETSEDKEELKGEIVESTSDITVMPMGYITIVVVVIIAVYIIVRFIRKRNRNK